MYDYGDLHLEPTSLLHLLLLSLSLPIIYTILIPLFNSPPTLILTLSLSHCFIITFIHFPK